MSHPRIPESIEIGEDGQVYVDGGLFPFFVLAESIKITVDPGGAPSTVRLTLIAESVAVRKRVTPDVSRHRLATARAAEYENRQTA
jgi:hypothetical protein